MSIVFNIPTWGMSVIVTMLAITAAVNLWHAIILRRYLRRKP